MNNAQATAPEAVVGYIDPSGELRIPARFSFGSQHVGGLAPARRADGRLGYIGYHGNWVVPPAFDWADIYKDDAALVSVNGRYGYIDRSGLFLVKPTFTSLDALSEGLGCARSDSSGLDGYIDRRGEMVIAPAFKAAGRFAEGFASVSYPEDPSQYWFVDRTGARRFGPFAAAERFSEGLAVVSDEGRTFYIDREGNEALTLPPCVYGKSFSGGYAAAQDQSAQPYKYGLIRKDGSWAVPPEYDYAWPHGGDFAVVRIDEAYGMIDTTGRTVLPFEYEDVVGGFNNGLVLVKAQGRFGYADMSGRLAIPLIYRLAQPFSEGLAAVWIV